MVTGRRRIAIVVPTLERGGTEGQTAKLAAGLKERGDEVLVLCVTRGGELATDLQRQGIRVEVLGQGRSRDLRVGAQLVWALRGFRPDVVHCALFSANTLGRVAGWLTGTPGLIASVRSIETRRDGLRRFVDRALSRVTDRIVVNAQAVADHVVAEGSARAEQVVVIRNGVDIDWFDTWRERQNGRSTGSAAKAAVGLTGEHPVVGMVARFDPRKGIDMFLDVADLLLQKRPSVEFLLVGDAHADYPDQIACKADTLSRVSRSPLAKRLALPGLVSDVRPYLAAMDVFLFPSRTEGLPNAVAEAMAMARPLVVTAVGGVAEMVRPGVDGLLVSPDDTRGMCDAALTLLNDRETAQKLGTNAREHVRREFSMATMVDRVSRLYDEVLRG